MLKHKPSRTQTTADRPPSQQSIVSGVWVQRRWMAWAALLAGLSTFLVNVGLVGSYEATAQVSLDGASGAIPLRNLQETVLGPQVLGAAIDRLEPTSDQARAPGPGQGTMARTAPAAIGGRVSIEPTDLKDVFAIAYVGPDRRIAAPLVNDLARSLAKQGAASNGHQGTIVSFASAPVLPAGSILLPTVAAVLAAIIAALAALLIREKFQPGLKDLKDEAKWLNLPVAFMVPKVPGRSMDRADISVLPIVAPGSDYAEAFRAWLKKHEGVRSVAICSSVAGEGKSTTAISLARTAALAGKRAVIIDCDGRMRAASLALNVREHSGLVQVIEDEVALDDALVRDEASGLVILGNGNQAAAVDLWTHRQHEGLDRIIRTLTADFDLIVIDTPPLLALAEARQTASLAEEVLLVTRWRSTPLGAIRAAVRTMASQGLKPKLVLTFVQFVGSQKLKRPRYA